MIECDVCKQQVSSARSYSDFEYLMVCKQCEITAIKKMIDSRKGVSD